MKSILMSIRLYYFYCTYKGIKTVEIRKKFPFNYKGKIYEYVSKTNWKQDLMKIPEEEREFFKQFVGKVGLCFECDKVEEIFSYLDTSTKFYEEQRFRANTLTCYELVKRSCLYGEELDFYLTNRKGFAIPISNFEIFDKSKKINEFYKGFRNKYYKNPFAQDIHKEKNALVQPTKYGYEYTYPLTKAPQSWCYIEVEE